MKVIYTFLFSLVWTFQIGMAQSAITRQTRFNTENGLAIKGYDPVSYFTQHKAVKGKKEFAIKFEGITYYFSSSANQHLFRTNPAKYEPLYGGWCAYALGDANKKVDIDPDTFKIINGKLYLFYNNWGNNTLLKWNKDESNLKAKADQNWKNMN